MLVAPLVLACSLGVSGTNLQTPGSGVSTSGASAPGAISDEAYLAEFKKKISVGSDIRLFTVFAFINYTGFDEENNPKGFHPVRKLVRDRLKNMNIKITDDKYYENQKLSSIVYQQLSKNLTSPPNFKWIKTNQTTSRMGGFPQKIREFYFDAKIDQLSKEVWPYYVQEIEKYNVSVHSTLISTCRLVGFKPADVPRFKIHINLLDSYWRGTGLTAHDMLSGDGTIITGPSDRPNLMNISHEFLHGVFGPILDSHRLIINSNNSKFDQIPEGRNKEIYGNWYSIVNESFVRALSRLATLTPEEGSGSVRREVESGFLMTEYIYSRWKEFDPNRESLDAFTVKLLKEYK